MNLISFCSRVIRYSFYLIFLLVPLIFAGNTSELFELNKMWFTWIATIIIMLAWLTKMVVEKKIVVQRTVLDIPILLFLLSQTISTIFSLDPQVSWWGYYSRFNGGLLSTITYVLLYYAFVSNIQLKHVIKLLKITLIGGFLTAIWGFPSHFGADPTCLVFRGTFDTSCWTDAFRPTIRAFSTLGQPAWFAAYLAALIPVSLAFALNAIRTNKSVAAMYVGLTMLFYSNLIFTNTRAGFLAFLGANAIFWFIIFWKNVFSRGHLLRYFIIINGLFLFCTFLFGIPFEGARQLTLVGIQERSRAAQQAPTPPAETPTQPTEQTQPAEQPPVQTGITDSGNIREYVWKGALDAWKANPVFGTGVETFAFAYYKFRPVGHNLTSEWDYLYNKAHNEYLNYLTTTGLFGLGTYLAFLALFILVFGKWMLAWRKTQKDYAEDATLSAKEKDSVLVIGLFAGWLSILVTNFFGFSVVIMNLFLFMIPLFVFIIKDALPDKQLSFGTNSSNVSATNPYQWSVIVIAGIFSGYLIVSLITYWNADTKYALGANLDRVGSYKDAYPLLLEAVLTKQNEAVYKDEFAINVAVLATALAQSGDKESASQFANNALQLNQEIIDKHPNNVVYWKNRVRLLYTLAQAVAPEQQIIYYQEALRDIQQAAILAPTDAKIAYNLGVLYGQTGNYPKAIEVLTQTITMKPDYKDAYFALGLFYHQAAVDANNRVIHPELNDKAITVYQDLLNKFGPDEEIQKNLDEWGGVSQSK